MLTQALSLLKVSRVHQGLGKNSRPSIHTNEKLIRAFFFDLIEPCPVGPKHLVCLFFSTTSVVKENIGGTLASDNRADYNPPYLSNTQHIHKQLTTRPTGPQPNLLLIAFS